MESVALNILQKANLLYSVSRSRGQGIALFDYGVAFVEPRISDDKNNINEGSYLI